MGSPGDSLNIATSHADSILVRGAVVEGARGPTSFSIILEKYWTRKNAT
jgi:hypothetical protein